ncbi:cryptochrome DASH [Didymella exigua CBS 183.55]|uniref:Cryptochrome DASH n=1 Tax=Didymella exigua CBS 183.55 TaxID=1150837 RepID=A0A6A5RNC0_9PLEO|nr:cryptochrome DASH [Didymella exigua CBS 183.55]KAF1929272.1 cryptochrome DASH [Didymella exigua CBS 183.55]
MSDEKPRILLYILRRDARLSDNPIFTAAARHVTRQQDSASPSKADLRTRDDSLTSEHRGSSFTHLLPVYIFPAQQIESSGFLASPSDKSPYPEARSHYAKMWRTGPHRARFIAEGVWDLKQSLEDMKCGSGLQIRVGMIGDVVKDILEYYSKSGGSKGEISGVWMTANESVEEKEEEVVVKGHAKQHGVDFKLWDDEKYYIDNRDLPFDNISQLPNIYTTFRKSVEPLRDQPRRILPAPTQLPPLPPDIAPQASPFKIPTNFDDLMKALRAPFDKDPTFGLVKPPQWPGGGVESAHPFSGGETYALERISHLISSGAMSSYKATRNGMLGRDFSTKLSAYLAQGHCTARQIHWAMLDFEEGRGNGKGVQGYGKGENDGTAAVRFELLWRDYFHLCMRKFGSKMFHLYGIRPQESRNNKTSPPPKNWKRIDKRTQGNDPARTLEAFCRFRSGRTGVGLIDASNRELFLTGYTSNRARQNVASFLASHLEIDWRIGAEWYECMLIDYDVPSNWGNWQYVSGVGNDPRQGRVFNPVKQALDYDPQGEYIKAWVPELRDVKLTKQVGPQGREEIDKQRLMGLYQANKLAEWEKESLGLKGVEWVERPLVNINFSVGRGRGGPGRGGTRPGRGGGGGGGGPGRGGHRGGHHPQQREHGRGANGDKPHVMNGPTIVSSQ